MDLFIIYLSTKFVHSMKNGQVGKAEKSSSPLGGRALTVEVCSLSAVLSLFSFLSFLYFMYVFKGSFIHIRVLWAGRMITAIVDKACYT